jgi:UDP-N-acetylmuramoyl-L-alanyl-D-glutamate--2,6-diaminopimelate ligase
MLLPKIFPVTSHTDHVGPGSTFVAIKGFSQDGTAYIPTALEKGATEIIVQQESHNDRLATLCAQHKARYTVVPCARKALAERASQANGDPWKKLKIIGITGTKGKTTTAFITEYLLRNAGYKTALISTIAVTIMNESEPSKHTTPESDYLQCFFAACVTRGVEYVVMEVSSHALSLCRVHGIQFDAIGFSNLSQDHLDFYGTMEAYFQAKMQLLSMLKPNGTMVINTDTTWGQQALGIATALAPACNANLLTYGTQPHPNAHHSTMAIQSTNFDGITITLDQPLPQTLHCASLFGPFNGYNIAMAVLLCNGAAINAEQGLATFPGVPGRLQRHQLQTGAYAFVDYAHNALSFQEVLSMLRPYTNHLIVVFGCGGNRPKQRRPAMGAIAAQFADAIILTDDNPRFEDRMTIINDILEGIPADKRAIVTCQPDRYQAISQAAQCATKGSIIALLGKGHEPYYSIQGKDLHFDDFEEIRKF